LAAGRATKKRSRSATWRRWNNAVHRDLGYFCVALTVIYAVSGLAVNHVEDWNPNYRIERVRRTFEPVPVGERDAMVAAIVQRLDLPDDYVDAYRPRPETVEIFYDGFTVTAHADRGVATWETRAERKVLYDLNFLHLNYGKGVWTWFADLYALALIVLAGTGIFVLRGRPGITGRGKWFMGAGFVVPVFLLWLLRYAG
jgi:hypothetical protein